MTKKSKLSGRADEAYLALQHRIVSGELKPGTPLSEQELTKELNSSRTPIREALVTLEQDGLITRMANRGWFVREVTKQDIEEVFELRKLLEVHALQTSIRFIPKEKITDLLERMRRLDAHSPKEDYFELDRELHDLFSRYCGNRRLVSVLEMLNTQIEWNRVVSARRSDRLRESRAEHIGILEALEAGDVDVAAERLGNHIDHVRENTLEIGRSGL